MRRNLFQYIVTLYLALTMASASAQPSPGSPYALEVSKARAVGIPIHYQDAFPKMPPASRNAASLYERFAVRHRELLKTALRDSLVALSKPQVPTARQLQIAVQEFSKAPDLLPLIEQATKLPFYALSTKASTPFQDTPEAFAYIRDATRYLTARSMELIHRNQPKEAIRVQALGFKIAAHVGQHPTLAAYRVAHAVEAVTSTGMTKILYLMGGNGEIAKEVRKAVELNWKPHSFLPALRTEIAFELDKLEETRRNGLADLDAVRTQLPPTSAAGTPSRPEVIARWNALIDKTAIYLLKTAREILPYFDRPYSEARPRLRAITELAKATATRPTSLQFTFFPEAIDDYLEGYTEQIYGQLKVQTLRTGAAVLAARAARKNLPSGLAEAIQPVPIDLFTLQPLSYRPEGRGFVVFSSGAEGHYRGGSPERRPNGASAVFRFPIPDYFRAN